MFGLDSLLSTLESLITRIGEFFTLTKEKGIGGAIETIATNSINDMKAKAEESLSSIPATFEKGAQLYDQAMGVFSGEKMPTTSTTGPDGNAPATTPATTPAASTGRTAS